VFIMISAGYDQGGIGVWNTRPMQPIGVPWWLLVNGAQVRGGWEPWSHGPTDKPFWLIAGSASPEAER
jgi:hypothetical protein